MAAIVQIAADGLGRPLAGARVLDLGAADGAFALEFARQGAEVTALEGREGNVRKLCSARDAQGLSSLEVVKEDVRNLSAERFGQFDLVLFLGLLYHLEAEAVVRAAEQAADVCRRLAIVDTHISLRGRTEVRVGAHTYYGSLQREFDPEAGTEEQERLSRSALGNPESFWPTRASLYNLLGDAGFTSVSDVVWPRHPKRSDRLTLMAFRGTSTIESPIRWAESERAVHVDQGFTAQLRRRLAPHLPVTLKERRRRRREAAR